MKVSQGNGYFLAFSYLVVGVAWVVGSDYILGEATNVPVAAHLIASLKGTLFVVVTSVLLFLVQSKRVAPTSPAEHDVAERALRDSEARCRSLTEDITALKAAQLALREARDHLEERVAERTTELEQAKNAAEHSDRVKSAFLSTMSHELRTPLNSILGFTDVLLQGLSGPLAEAQQRQMRIVRDSAAHLRSLIEDVLDISRIEAGQIALEFTDLDVCDLVSRRAEAFGAEYERKGIKLEVRAAAAVPTIRSDRKRTGQIVNNLLSNALKFTEQGNVTVDIRCAAENLELRVIDTGVGIPASALTHLFNPFTQVIRPGGRMHEGAGLGLAISRNLARALGGDLSVESQVGHGTCFTFRLPRVAREVEEASASGLYPRLHVRRPLPHHAVHDTALSASTRT